ncbi:MarR family winged helix-turn-helix transcriptional regulator [Leifsonia sp. fls2-241-R2A-40a]|uniref:MarR family winged helix-turn-helix transcriptional regulator n=1 Tax=Leifsonia sp. fls2-241-R2A-40a TaxID=3040290 RepID=UPI00254F6371|nr:MarR family winged helix-turn-helix transcriptional regulator [Leifsonia sp. fls2-241-R2A-40a]
MTNIDDSAQTPPGYWFGVIEERLHERMRDALSDLGLRRGSWRILHTLADGPATAQELADRLPHGDRGGRFGHPHRGGPAQGGRRGGDPRHPEWNAQRPGFRAGWRSQEPRDEQPATAEGQRPVGDPAHHDHGHHDDHGHEHHHGREGFEHAFERGYERGFDRGFAFGAARTGHPFAAPFPPTPFGGPFPGGHPQWGPFPGGDDFRRRRFPVDRENRRGHRIHRVLADFVERGWVWFDGDRATLTDEGRAAHDAAFERVQSVRAELANGISEGDYATTMRTLEAMARNLGWHPAASQAAPESPQDGAPNMDA